FGAALARPGCRPVGGGEVANSPRCSSLCEALGEESGVLPFGEKILALPQGDGDALVPADVVIGISAVPEILCRQGPVSNPFRVRLPASGCAVLSPCRFRCERVGSAT